MVEELGAPMPEPHIPDAQDTVRDFMDYTDVFPSDLMRSLTLIGQLDHNYLDATDKIHQLTTTYGSLPTRPQGDRPNAQDLRKNISQALDYALYCRESAFAEASRLLSVAERYEDRLDTIKRKLKALPEPPSRDPTPPPVSPQRTRKDHDRAPKLTLTLGGGRGRGGSHKKLGGGVTVPGGVLPAGIIAPISDNDSDWEQAIAESPGDTRASEMGRGLKKLEKKPSQSNKGPKGTPRRAPGVMGTNVHSAVAGISTSNALAKLTPPPIDAKPGSKHAPWFKLTEWEMATLRKTMKKNAIWSPSETMIRRELAKKGRGKENYENAKTHAEATGEPLIDDDPVDPSKTVFAPGEVSCQPSSKDEQQLMNRGMKLNEAKKLKKETLAREQAARDAMEIEEATKALANAGDLIKNAFSHPKEGPGEGSGPPADASPSQASKKRKRQPSSPESTKQDPKSQPESAAKQGPKRLKLAPPAPPSADAVDEETLASPSRGTSSSVTDIAPLLAAEKTNTTQVPLAPPAPSPKKSTAVTSGGAKRGASATASTSPVETKKSQPGLPVPAPVATAATSRSRRTSVAPKASEPSSPINPPEPDLNATSRIRPRSAAGASMPTKPSTKAASAEPPGKRESRELRELRRMSNVSLPSPSENKPQPAGTRTSGRRGKRPAPGLVTADEDGRKVSVGKRKAAPRKKGAVGKMGGKMRDGRASDPAAQLANENWDDGEPVDPDEPRYCICGDVSYGTMIACENDDCEKEWFHLECVGMAEIPPRRTKWYCEDCRKSLGIDEKGGFADQAAARRSR